MKFTVLTLFPEVFDPYLQASIIGSARAKSLIETSLINIRDFATDTHRTVDDTPYGGGPGMVMKIAPIHAALQSLQSNTNDSGSTKTLVLAARGQQLTQSVVAELAKLSELKLICGRYEGIDQRVADHLADGELSIGPYVLAGGELAALVVIEAVSRLIPGVLGNPESLTEESHSISNKLIQLQANAATKEYPQYTKPETYNGWQVPPVLLSGNHAAITAWRNSRSAEVI